MSNEAAQMIETLRSEFGSIKNIDPAGGAYKSLCAILDSAADQTLLDLRAADIRFVSSLALNRCLRRGILPVPA